MNNGFEGKCAIDAPMNCEPMGPVISEILMEIARQAYSTKNMLSGIERMIGISNASLTNLDVAMPEPENMLDNITLIREIVHDINLSVERIRGIL